VQRYYQKNIKNLALGIQELEMYEKNERQLTLDEFIFPFGKLNPENRWVKLAKEIPWIEVEDMYSKKFRNNGNRAKSLRVALGSLIIKQFFNCSDVETVNHVEENPYLQFFLGMKEYSSKAPFSSQSMVEFRKRFNEDDILAKVNEMIINHKNENKKSDDQDTNNSSQNSEDTPVNHEAATSDSHEKVAKEGETSTQTADITNKGKLVIDATCAPADVAFPQDLKLLNKAREKTEKMIDLLHDSESGKKPRTYRKTARKCFLKLSKAKRKSGKELRKGIRKQLGFLGRNLAHINSLIDKLGNTLSERLKKELETIRQIFNQQLSMFKTRTHSVPDRIVSINQPHVRPMPRGKEKVKTEFGAKVEISIVDGFARIETLSFDAFNEGKSLIRVIESYKERNGFYPERVLVDKLYRN
jgi:hypothetical protein